MVFKHTEMFSILWQFASVTNFNSIHLVVKGVEAFKKLLKFVFIS